MLQFWIWKVKNKLVTGFQELLNSERGDTNFISILIILAIVVIVAGVFLFFKDQILGQVNNIVTNFTIK